MLLLTGEAHRDRLARRGTTPDLHGNAALQDHVVAKDPGQADVGADDRCQGEQEE
jgi:hypothetical protein